MPFQPTPLASKSAAFQVEAAVVGAGVIGLAIGRALAKAGKEVIILDRAGAIGSETSSRNSEVIHAGLYYPPDSRKAAFCVQGKNLIYKYCESRNILYRNCGKLIVASQKSQLETQLPSLQQHAIRNGVHDTKMLTPEDVSIMEPKVTCVGALWSPSTGVVDSHSFMLGLLADAEDHGATMALHANLSTTAASDEMAAETTMEITGNPSDGVLLKTDDSTWLQCKTVVNSAGLWAHHVARAIHRNNSSDKRPSYCIPRQYFAKGNYFRLEGSRHPFHHLVYPLPEPGGLGVHATIDWSEQRTVKFGPDVEWVDIATEDPGMVDLTPLPERADGFYEQIRKYWPGLPDDALVPDYAGIRPKLHHPSLSPNGDTPFHDYIISMPDQHGIPGLIHLFGMESPGLTSSMAIGDYIVQKVRSWE